MFAIAQGICSRDLQCNGTPLSAMLQGWHAVLPTFWSKRRGMPRGTLPFTSAGESVPGTWLQLNAGRWADRLRHCSPVGLLILLRIYPDISDGIVISA